MRVSIVSKAVLAINCCSTLGSASPGWGPGYRDDYQPQQDAVRLLYQYPEGTWVENIAIRPSGELLLTILSSPKLDQLNPFDEDTQPETVFTFPEASGALGIAEIDDDVFATVAGNFSLATGNPSKGSWNVWKANFSSGEGVVDRITSLPDFLLPNGMSNLPSTPLPNDILVGDIFAGKIWRVDTTTGAHEVVIENNITATAPNPTFGAAGVNGIHVRDNTLYLTNTGQALFASMPVSANGTPLGAPSIISRFNASESADDFTLRGDSAFLVTGAGNGVEQVSLSAFDAVVLAGQLNSTQIAEPTSCAFGRTAGDSWVLYVVTAGGMAIPVEPGNRRVGAQVLAIDTRRWVGGNQGGWGP